MNLFANKSVAYYLVHLIIIIALYYGIHSLLTLIEVNRLLPNEINLAQWDAGWYKHIAEKGYQFTTGVQCNSGFFPLFPLLWKLLGLKNVSMALVNLSLFLISVIALAYSFKIEVKYLYLFLSFPATMFFYVPYTESLFFFFTTFILVGFLRNNLWLICFGLFFASTTRSSAMFFVPAIFLVALFDFLAEKKMVETLKRTTLYVVSSLAGLFTVVFYQYYKTGVWFAFAKAQFDGWKHNFKLPVLPLQTWDDVRLLWLDSSGIILGLLSLVVLLVLIRKAIKYEQKVDAVFAFSTGNILMILFYGLFFSGLDPSGYTSIVSMGRYFFASPFFFVFLFSAGNYFSISLKSALTVIITTGLGIALAGIGHLNLPWLARLGNPDQKIKIYFLLCACYVISHVIFALEKKNDKSFYLLFIPLNMILQINCLNYYLMAIWVG